MSNLILRGRWGGGPDFLLAAATRQHIYIFSLLDFFLYRVQHHTLLQPATSAGAAAGAAAAPGAAAATGAVGPAAEEAAAWPPATMPLPGSCSSSCLVATHRLAHPLAALDWTADARGLLYTDTGQAVAMLQVQGGSAYHLPSRRMVPGKAVVQVAWTATTDTLHTGGWAAGLGCRRRRAAHRWVGGWLGLPPQTRCTQVGGRLAWATSNIWTLRTATATVITLHTAATVNTLCSAHCRYSHTYFARCTPVAGWGHVCVLGGRSGACVGP